MYIQLKERAMSPLLLAALTALHVLPGVFWAGSTFVLARSGGQLAERLARPQMGAATAAVLAGLALGALTHTFGAVLGVGAVCAVAAAGVQGSGLPLLRRLANADEATAAAIRRGVARRQQIAALLLAIAVVCMVTFRYA